MSLLASSAPSPLSYLADLLDPPDDAFGLLGFVPNPGPQTRFLEGFEEPNTDQLYGGAAGGSKSTSLLVGALRASVRYPGLQTFWFRRTFPELEQSVIRMLSRLNYQALGATWKASTHELRFANGSIITLAHAKNMQEATALQSAEIQLLILDERTTIPPDVVDMLYTRVRSGVPGVPCLGIRSGTNPGGIGHSRVRSDFVEATDHGGREIIDKSGRLRRFIQARLTDTPQLGPEYEASFAGYSEALRKAFRDGDWDVFAGQVFSEWRYDRHVVKPIYLPKEWRRHGGIDWGHRAPSAVLWSAQDQDERVWVYREIYAPGLGEKGLAERIKAEGPEHCVFAFDPAMANKVGDAMPVASVLRQEGIPLVKANNDRLSGWQRVHSYLAEGPACPVHRLAGEETCPMLHVFENCTELIRTLPALPYNTIGQLEDVDTKAEDHAPDALRYLLMELGTLSRPVLWDDEPPAVAPDGTPLQPVLPGWTFAGDTSSGLDDADSNPNRGGTAKSPFTA